MRRSRTCLASRLGRLAIRGLLCSRSHLDSLGFLGHRLGLLVLGELLRQFGVGLQHRAQLRIGAAVEAEISEHVHRLRLFVLLGGGRFFHIFLEDADPLDFRQYLIDACRTIGRLLLQKPEDDAVHFRCHVRIEFRRVRRFVAQVASQQFLGGRRLKGCASGQDFEEQDAEAVQIRLKGWGLFADGLGGDVRAGSLDRLQLSAADQLGKARYFLAGE